MDLSRHDVQKGERIKLAILALVACLGILYLAPKVLSVSIFNTGAQDYFDFQEIWVPGRIRTKELKMARAPARQVCQPGFIRPIGIPLLSPSVYCLSKVRSPFGRS